jgi:ABC-type nitrate/sulfonate/bicarbonate transport system permease component
VIRRLRLMLPPLLVVATMIASWELYVDVGGVNQFFLPAPHSIARSLWENFGFVASNLATTALVVGTGVLLALVVGFALAVSIHFSRRWRRAIYPLTIGSQAIPIPVIAPLLVFWWGFGVLPKLFVITLICFFPVVVTTVDGLRRVEPDQLKLLRTLDASRWQAFRLAELPAALPAALSGARIAVTVGVIAAYIAETSTAGTSSGLGHEIITDQNSFQNTRAWAAAVVLFAFAIVCFYILALAERRLAHPHQSRGDHP